MMELLKGANLALRFLLELTALFIFGYWGFRVGSGGWLKGLLGIGTPLLVAVVWGAFVAPKAAFPLNGLLSYALQIVIFGSAALALYFCHYPKLSYLLAAIVAINMILLAVWRQ